MKLFSKIFFGLILISALISSCSDTVTYAEELQAEKTLIANFIKRNNIKVVSKLPAVNAWTENTYYLSSTGLYFHLVSPGDTTVKEDSLVSGMLVVPRYIQYTLSESPDSISNWNTVEYPYPSTFTYLNSSTGCSAWQEAAAYMKYNGSQAKIIVPSKLGFSTYQTTVTPLGYDLKIKTMK